MPLLASVLIAVLITVRCMVNGNSACYGLVLLRSSSIVVGVRKMTFRVKIKSLRALFVRVTVLLIFNFSDMD